MIPLTVADLALIAGRVLGLDDDDVLDQLDLAAAIKALGIQPPGGHNSPAGGAAPLLYGVIRFRPFPSHNTQIALIATTQFLSLNGWEVDLNPPRATHALLTDIHRSRLGPPELATWLTSRLRPACQLRTPPETPMRKKKARHPNDQLTRLLTKGAQQAIDLAEQEARALGHNYLGTEHLLLGLILLDNGVAFHVLSNLGISPQAARDQVEEIIGQGFEASTDEIPSTPRTRRVLDLARREADNLGHRSIGTEHILLGLIAEGEGVAAQVLGRLGADLHQTRRQVIEVLHSTQDAEQSSRIHPPSDALARVMDMTLGDLIEDSQRVRHENQRLRALLSRHGIEPDEATTQDP